MFITSGHIEDSNILFTEYEIQNNELNQIKNEKDKDTAE